MRRYILPGAALLALTAGAAFAQSSAPKSSGGETRNFSQLTALQAAKIARSAGFDLIDVGSCLESTEDCALFAVRDRTGAASVLQLSTAPCEREATGTRCFGRFLIVDEIAASEDRMQPGGAGKLSGKPGKDGLPPDPQDEAQAEATNQIIEALGDGKYDDNLEQFWADLESIKDWNMPTWIEPDPPLPTLIEGRPLPSALGLCRPERRTLEKNEPRCDEPPLTPIGGTSCTANLLPSFTPTTNNLIIQNWDQVLQKFVYFDNNHPNPTKQDVDLLTAAWNFLVENADIAGWSTCLVEGPSNSNCIGRRLSGETTQRFEFVDKLPLGCPKGAGMCTAFIGTKTSIKLSAVKRDREIYFDPGQTEGAKLCLLTTYAAVLLHEMLHSCLAVFTQSADDFGLGPYECGCDTTDMAEAAFAHSIAQRYPCLAATGGCGFLGAENMWLTPCDFSYNNPPGPPGLP